MSLGMDVNMMKIVLDTNILVSAFVYGGNPQDIFELIIIKQITGVTSLPLIVELIETLIKKFGFSSEKVYQIETKVKKNFEFVSPAKAIEAVRDKDDNRVLEAAVEGDCDFIITGDQDLLELGKYRKIKIVTPKQFLEELNLSKIDFCLNP